MTYYTPPELREEMERFDIVLSNPPFHADYPTGSRQCAANNARSAPLRAQYKAQAAWEAERDAAIAAIEKRNQAMARFWRRQHGIRGNPRQVQGGVRMKDKIYINLSDGSSCHGGPVQGEPGRYWLRRTHGDVYSHMDAAAPAWARQQAEAALAEGWKPGADITVEVQP
jgi:hypothetical protein